MSGETKQQLSNLIAENALLKRVVADMAQKPTLRDKFAMAALTGIVTRPATYYGGEQFAEFANDAYVIADAMLKERDDEQA